MVIVEADRVTRELGGRPIFSHVSFTITAGERVGIVGRNGAGKTTLLEMLAGLAPPTEGAVRLNSRITVGYLEQLSMEDGTPVTPGDAGGLTGGVPLPVPAAPPAAEGGAGTPAGPAGKTVFETAAEGLAHLDEQEEELHSLAGRIEALSAGAAGPGGGRTQGMGGGDSRGAGSDGDGSAGLQRLLRRYERAAAAFERAGGYEGPARIRSFLFGLGFGEHHMDRPVNTLSGGQQARVFMARLLASSPDFMLLDEPTNHLDLASLEWLESFLSKYDGTLAVVSHDRAFLDAVATRIIEIEDGTVEDYPGNYTFYLEEKRRRRESSAARLRRLELEKQRLEEFIRRFGAGTRARQARDRLRKLRRLEAELAEVRRERPGRAQEAGGSRGKLRFDPGVSSYAEVLAVEDLGHAYEPITSAGEDPAGEPGFVFDGLTGLVRRGDRIALVGPNGSGKSTFLKILAGRIKPVRGITEFGRRVKIGYFAQDLGHLNSENTVLQEITAAGVHEAEGRSLLARFLFRGDEVFNRVKNLSGGEKTRLALAQLMVSGANVLLLDEPTNHLDLAGQEALGDALETFPGTIIFASHDRFLLRQAATDIWAFTGDGGVQIIDGGFDRYVEWLRRAQSRDSSRPGAGVRGGGRVPGGTRTSGGDVVMPGGKGGAGDGVTPGGRDGPAGTGTGGEGGPAAGGADTGKRGRRPLPPWERERLQRELEDLEEQITALEADKELLSRQLSDPETFKGGGGAEVVTRFQHVEDSLDASLQRWETVARLLE